MSRRWAAISRRLGQFDGDRRTLLVLLALALVLAGRVWLQLHPQHDPWAPLDLRDPPGLATGMKIRALEGDVSACRAVLARSRVAFTSLSSEGQGQCARPDRTVLSKMPLAPSRPATTCPVAISLVLWKRDTLVPAARDIFGQEIKSVEHLGTYSCRRMYGRSEGPWSEHATGNAIDVAGFVLADGSRISVLRDWQGEGKKARFLRRVRDGACKSFGTVLSPDYNAAHRDHLHLDDGRGWGGACR